jgi:hypothetical protein
MEIITEDVRDTIEVLSMPDLLAFMDIHPRETCYPSVLRSEFLSQFAFEDTQRNLEEIFWWPKAMKAFMVTQQASPPDAIIQMDIISAITAPSRRTNENESPSGLCPQRGTYPPPPSGTRDYPSGAATIMISQDGDFPGVQANHSDCDIVNSLVERLVSHYNEQTPAQSLAFQCLSVNIANEKK